MSQAHSDRTHKKMIASLSLCLIAEKKSIEYVKAARLQIKDDLSVTTDSGILD
jgi:hypothetical protein